MKSWKVMVSVSGCSRGDFSHDFEEEPMVGQDFEVNWEIPGGRIPQGIYSIISVNVHCFHIVIEPKKEAKTEA